MMARQRKSGSKPKRRKEYHGGGAWGGRFSQRELEREIAERPGLAELLEPERPTDGGRHALRWAAVAVLLWLFIAACWGLAYALR